MLNTSAQNNRPTLLQVVLDKEQEIARQALKDGNKVGRLFWALVLSIHLTRF
jgi:hypothetical protein